MCYSEEGNYKHLQRCEYCDKLFDEDKDSMRRVELPKSLWGDERFPEWYCSLKCFERDLRQSENLQERLLEWLAESPRENLYELYGIARFTVA